MEGRKAGLILQTECLKTGNLGKDKWKSGDRLCMEEEGTTEEKVFVCTSQGAGVRREQRTRKCTKVNSDKRAYMKA